MSLDPLTAIFEVGKIAIDKIWPDPTKRAEELRKLEELKQTGDLARLDAHVKLMLGQISVNLQEAKHKSWLVAGARPFILWVGGLSLAYKYLLYEWLIWGWTIFDVYTEIPQGVTPPPSPDASGLYPIILGLLGIGGMRSFEKIKGVQTDNFGKQ